MDARKLVTLRRLAVAFLFSTALGGCAVYGPPYAAYDPYSSYPSYGYPAYVGPPVTVDLGFGFYSGHRHHHHGHHGWRSHGGKHGWSHHGGRHGWSHHGGGWRHGRGRH